MKKLTYLFLALVFISLNGILIQAQTLVNQWGTTPRGTANWPVLNTPETPDGSASMGADASPTGWTSIKGGFDAVTPTTTEALVITGTFEFVGGGGGSAYTWMRYALFDGAGVLTDRNTPAAAWSETSTCNGYLFTPVSGTGTISNTWRTYPQGNTGTEWYLVNAASWVSTNNSDSGPISIIRQAPNRQIAVAGVYDWAISVQPLDDGTNEVRWYFIQQHAEGSSNYYWWGGSFIDPTPVTNQFNSIAFGVNSDVDDTCTEVRLADVTVGLGDPITVPVAPWQAFYVDDWGTTPRGTANWPVLNDETYLVGNASMGADAKPTGWTSIKGGFNPVTLVPGKAMIISGTFEFVGGGGGSAYTWLRYALFNGAGVLTGKNTTAAAWSEDGNGNGYIFTPVTGTGTISNTYRSLPEGNQGTEWYLIDSKSWTSTNSNGGGPISIIRQAPNRQVAVAGVYDWAISVEPLDDGTNEVRWYFIQQHAEGSSNYYWWGGSFIDPTPVTNQFNSIGFGVNSDIDDGCIQVNINDVQVDMGDPITVPVAPWQAFYVDDWGTTPRGTANWPVLNDETYLVGNASMGADAKPTGWTSIKGGFNPVTLVPGKAMIITGTFEFVGGGGGSAYTWLRYALFNGAGVLTGKNTTAAAWSEDGNGNGYIFTPVTGTGTISNTWRTWPQGNQGTEWYLIDSKSWNSTNNNGSGPISIIMQAPARQVAVAGVYDWAISVEPLDDGTNEVRWYFIQQHAEGSTNYYWWGGSFIDPTPVTNQFNSIGFGVNSDIDDGCIQVNINDVQVDMGDPITVPEAPWQAYYVDKWGFTGGRTAGWTLTPGEVIGNVSISGTADTYYWTTLRGGFFEPITPTEDKALIVTGLMEFTDGGFTAWNSLRMGLFYKSAPGSVSNSQWTGTENHSGYLFIPHSGYADLSLWDGDVSGTVGAVVDDTWLYTTGADNYVIGSGLQTPTGAEGEAGMYSFAFSIHKTGDGGNEVRYYVHNDDDSYVFAGVLTDDNDPLVAEVFNSINFALNTHSNTTTSFNLYDVMIDYGDPIVVPGYTSVEDFAAGIPTSYTLMQNYPNPFNPTTAIEFALPQRGNISLVVYDVLGRVVANLVEGEYDAGYHRVNFDASGLSSGIYFYRLTAGDFVSVKKLMLLK